MAERKVGTVSYWKDLSQVLAVFRLMPEDGSRFPAYQAGQYIALRREDCKLTKRVLTVDGRVEYVPDVDEQGRQKTGQVTHSYSISSAPFETEKDGFLEFYVILETGEQGQPGRLTESFFRINPGVDDKIVYVNRITGDFTLEKRAAGYSSVLMVGTGTGLAPFVSMIKQLHNEGGKKRTDSIRYTLLHTNRTFEELAYHSELTEIERAGKFDFVYIPSVSRPTARDRNDPTLSIGRANNLLRSIFGMPLKEEQELREVQAAGGDPSAARAALNRAVRPVLRVLLTWKELLKRLDPAATVILTCGNPFSMADVKRVADANRIHFEKEDW